MMSLWTPYLGSIAVPNPKPSHRGYPLPAHEPLSSTSDPAHLSCPSKRSALSKHDGYEMQSFV